MTAILQGHSNPARRQPARAAPRPASGSAPRCSTRCSCAPSPTRNGSGAGDFAGLDRPARLPAVAGRRLPVAAAVLRVARCATAATTSPTTPRCCPSSARCRSSRELVAQAHARGIRIITDLVMNHTSDQHPWFQASPQPTPTARTATSTSGPTPTTKYTDARIIFVDTEVSNWTFDPIRRQFFWHRFFSHQPDLNFENPEVHEAMFDIVRFWMDMGIDGFRLDAVPYLFEEEGTNCENLPDDARVPRRAARHGRRGVPRPHPARRGQPAARARSSTTSAPRRRRSARCASTSR